VSARFYAELPLLAEGRRARGGPGTLGQLALPQLDPLGRRAGLVPDEVRPEDGGDRLEPVQADAGAQQRRTRRELAYGLHVSDRAHMTCLVFNYAGKHLHFIDGADGGLFSAARAFKERAAKLL
jgi:hypothetical protein